MKMSLKNNWTWFWTNYSKWSLHGSRYLSEERKIKNDGKDVIDLGGCYQLGSLSGRGIIGQHLQIFSFIKSNDRKCVYFGS